MRRAVLSFLLLYSFGMNARAFGEKDDFSQSSGSSSEKEAVVPQKKTKNAAPGGIRGLYDPKKRKYSRKLASDWAQKSPSWYLGIATHFDGPLAKVNSGEKLSRGLGYSAGLSLEYQMPTLRLGFEPSYQYLRLGRSIDGSDSKTAQVTQSNSYVGLGGYVSFLMESGGGMRNPWDPAWWTDVGTEILLPISSQQTSAFAEDLNLKADKLWLLLVGGTLDFAFPPNLLFKTRLHLFYNLPSTSEGRLFGVRAQIAFEFGLL